MVDGNKIVQERRFGPRKIKVEARNAEILEFDGLKLDGSCKIPACIDIVRPFISALAKLGVDSLQSALSGNRHCRQAGRRKCNRSGIQNRCAARRAHQHAQLAPHIGRHAKDIGFAAGYSTPHDAAKITDQRKFILQDGKTDFGRKTNVGGRNPVFKIEERGCF